MYSIRFSRHLSSKNVIKKKKLLMCKQKDCKNSIDKTFLKK